VVIEGTVLRREGRGVPRRRSLLLLALARLGHSPKGRALQRRDAETPRGSISVGARRHCIPPLPPMIRRATALRSAAAEDGVGRDQGRRRWIGRDPTGPIPPPPSC